MEVYYFPFETTHILPKLKNDGPFSNIMKNKNIYCINILPLFALCASKLKLHTQCL